MVKYVASNEEQFGNLIFIEHEQGVLTSYSHLDNIFVMVGEKVYKGDRIATMGNSGTAEFPSLYFEIRKSGGIIDVKKYLNR